jgi:hypothetical protein
VSANRSAGLAASRALVPDVAAATIPHERKHSKLHRDPFRETRLESPPQSSHHGPADPTWPYRTRMEMKTFPDSRPHLASSRSRSPRRRHPRSESIRWRRSTRPTRPGDGIVDAGGPPKASTQALQLDAHAALLWTSRAIDANRDGRRCCLTGDAPAPGCRRMLRRLGRLRTRRTVGWWNVEAGAGAASTTSSRRSASRN